MPDAESVPGKVLTPEEISKKAKENQNEKPKQKERDVKAIREWINSQPHLGQNAKQDDIFITAFLRGCKYSYEKTKKKIDSWHTVRTHAPDIFGAWDMEDPKIASIIEFGPSVPLKGYDKHGRKVIVIRSSYLDHSKVQLSESIRAGLMVNELMFVNPDEQATVMGVVMINDIGGADFNMVKGLNPAFMKKAMTIFQEAYPDNPKENHMVNMPPFMERVCQTMMSFGNKKVKERTKFYPKGTDYKKLHDALGKDVLPEEYGGNAGPIQLQIDEIKKSMQANRDFLAQQSRYKTDESKRPGNQKSYSDVFGMEGSFRQLEFD